MKKILCCAIGLLLTLSLISCTATDTKTDIADYGNQYHIFAPTLTEFSDLFSNDPIGDPNYVQLILQAVSSPNLTIDNFEISSVSFEPRLIFPDPSNESIQLPDESMCIFSIAWRAKGWREDYYAAKINYTLAYYRDGIPLPYLTQKCRQTATPNLYIDEAVNDRPTYVYIINDQYYAKWYIEGSHLGKGLMDLSDKQKAAIHQQFATFCSDFSKMAHYSNG